MRRGLVQSAARSGRGPAAPDLTRNTVSDRPFVSLSIVSKSATDQEIRKAYKRLSKKYHPDKNQSPGAEEKFVEVAQGMMNSCPVTFRSLKSHLLSLRGPF